VDPTDVTVQILREIRDEILGTNARIEQTNARIEQTNARIEQTNVRLDQKFDELGRRLGESEIRTATAINALVGTLGDIKQLLADRLDLRDRVERCERDIDELKRRAK